MSEDLIIFLLYLILMNKGLRFISKFLQAFDLFPTTQFLRYKQSGDYKTSTGGFVSIAIIIVFIILFYKSGVQTANQEIINSSISYQIQMQPQPITFSFSKGADFMFSVGLQYLDLSNSSKKYFNISLRQHHYGPLLTNDTFIDIPLVPCTADHFSYDQNTLSFYQKFRLSTNLCPPLNYDFQVGGRFISNIYQSLNLIIQYCNKTIDSTCATDAEVQALQNKFGGFAVYIPIMSTVINAGDSTYKKVFFQQRNIYYFTTKTGLWMNGQIQEFEVNTDVSLLPITTIQTEIIKTVPELFLVKSKTVFNGQYVQIVFDKSQKYTIFTRSFNKVDDYFSYVGGLIGTVLLIFFILTSYSEQSYVISIASDIYQIDQDSNAQPTKFNFFYFVALTFKKLVKFIGVPMKCEHTNNLQKAVQQMQKQLSINYLLKRINFFQEAISSILNQHQVKLLCLSDKKTIEDAIKQRKRQKNITHSLKQQKIQNKDGLHQYKRINKQSNQSKVSLAAFQFSQKQINLDELKEYSQSEKQGRKQQNANFANSLAQVVQEQREGNKISKKILEKLKTKYEQMRVKPKKNQSKDQEEMKEEKKQKQNGLIQFQFEEVNQ